MHSAKNAIIGTEKNRIVYLSKTYEGSVKGKRIIDEEKWQFPKGIKVCKDSGFEEHFQEGINIEIPRKKPKGKSYQPSKRLAIRRTSERVRVEHIIEKIKIYRIVKDTIRLRKKSYLGINDFVMEICCALHNFRLQYSSRLI